MKLTLWLPVILLVIFAGITFWLDHVVQEPQARRDGMLRHDMDYMVENFSATRLNPEGKPIYVLTARKMVHYPDDESTHLTTPHFTQFEPPQPPLHISAKRGLVSKNGENVYFMDDVQVLREANSAQSALTLTTPYLHIIPDLHLAKTDKRIVIKENATTINATGLEINSKTRVAKLFSKVRAQYANPRQN